MIPTKEPTLLDKRDDFALTPPPAVDDSPVAMFERLAMDPNVDVVKLERLIEMQERIMRHNAEAEFNRAFAAMLPEIPTIKERSRTDKTTYAPLEDIVEVVRPILSRHGFSLSFRTEWPDKAIVKVFGILTHTGGHSRQSEFVSGADQTGSKNAIQALGSAVSYGKRYTAKDLLCIVTREEDDDGRSSEKHKAADAPIGYDEWLTDMGSVADNGWPELSKAFGKSPEPYRKYLTTIDKAKWMEMKRKAEKVQK